MKSFKNRSTLICHGTICFQTVEPKKKSKDKQEENRKEDKGETGETDLKTRDQIVIEIDSNPNRNFWDEESNPTRRNCDGDLNPTRRNGDGELNPTRSNWDEELNPNRSNWDGELNPNRINWDGELSPTRRNWDGELNPTRSNWDEELNPNRRNWDGELYPTRSNGDRELNPTKKEETNSEMTLVYQYKYKDGFNFVDTKAQEFEPGDVFTGSDSRIRDLDNNTEPGEGFTESIPGPGEGFTEIITGPGVEENDLLVDSIHSWMYEQENSKQEVNTYFRGVI